MSISINTSIPACSKYVLFIDVPYRFSVRHFSAAFESAVPRPLTNRVYHAVMGTLLLLLPVINLVIAAVEYHVFPPLIPGKEAGMPIDPSPSSSDSSSLSGNAPSALVKIIPKDVATSAELRKAVATPEKRKEAATPEGRIQASLIEREKAWRANPYVIANHEELRPSTNPYKKWDEFNIFQDALENGNTEVAMRLIKNPHFKGLNTTYTVSIKRESCTSNERWFPLAIAAYKKQHAVFNMLLEYSATHLEPQKFPSDSYSPLLQICKLGAGYEEFISLLIKKKASPFLLEGDSVVSALDLARASNVAKETLQELEDWCKLNQPNARGNSRLHQAVQDGDTAGFRQALREGIFLNNRNGYGQTALHLAVLALKKADYEEAAQKMIDLLLQEKAQLNIQDRFGYTPLLDLVISQPPDWERYAIAFLKNGADPDIIADKDMFVSRKLLTYPSSHPVKAFLLEQPQGMHTHYQNQFNLSTILGSLMRIDIGRWSCAVGGNYSEAIYELLVEVLECFLVDPSVPQEMREMFEGAKQASLLAKEICFMPTSTEVIKKIQQVGVDDHPVLIPSGWVGHAISLVIYENRLICANVGDRPNSIQPGLGLYTFSGYLFNEPDFSDLIKHGMRVSPVKGGKDYYEKLGGLGCDHQSTTVLPEQVVGNCTWASSALLGLRAVLEIQNRWESQKIADAIVRFNQFSQGYIILKTVKYLQENVSKLPLPHEHRCLTSAASWLCQQLRDGKDSFGYYKAALDAIIFSGFVLEEFEYSKEGQVDKTFYAQLYSVSPQFLDKHLMKNPYEVGCWKMLC